MPVFHISGTLTGVRVYCEDSTNQGRMDAWFDFNDTIYLIEFKVALNKQQAETQKIKAIEQIKEKGYADKFKAQQTERKKPIVQMGIVFGKEERNIIDFVIEVIDF